MTFHTIQTSNSPHFWKQSLILQMLMVKTKQLTLLIMKITNSSRLLRIKWKRIKFANLNKMERIRKTFIHIQTSPMKFLKLNKRRMVMIIHIMRIKVRKNQKKRFKSLKIKHSPNFQVHISLRNRMEMIREILQLLQKYNPGLLDLKG
jgi:hypothetical protein